MNTYCVCTPATRAEHSDKHNAQKTHLKHLNYMIKSSDLQLTREEITVLYHQKKKKEKRKKPPPWFSCRDFLALKQSDISLQKQCTFLPSSFTLIYNFQDLSGFLDTIYISSLLSYPHQFEMQIFLH